METNWRRNPDPSRIPPIPPKKPGNNRYGAKGRLKCEECRRKKQMCRFNREESYRCEYCSSRNLQCGPKEYAGKKHQDPEPGRPYAAPSRRRSDRFQDDQADLRSQTSIVTERLSDLAARLESRHPSENRVQIYNRIGEILNPHRRPAPLVAAVDSNQPSDVVQMNQSTHNSFHERLHQTDQNLEGQFPCEATNAGAENDVPDVFNDNQLVYRPVWSPLTPLQFRVGPVGPPTGGAEQLDATQLFPNPEETFYSDEAESLYRTGV